MIDRCIFIISVHDENVEMPDEDETLAAEMLAVAADVEEMELGCGEADRLFLEPVESGLIARYGPDEGRRLYAEFMEAFEEAGCSLYAEATGAFAGVSYLLAS